jgi:PBP1b-binding outer membrane lipoprotein LpoB
MPSKRLTPLLGLAFLLVCCVGWGNAQGEQAKRENPQEQAATVQEGPLTVCQVL